MHYGGRGLRRIEGGQVSQGVYLHPGLLQEGNTVCAHRPVQLKQSPQGRLVHFHLVPLKDWQDYYSEHMD